VRKEDEGFFECQISTTPLVSHTIYLSVIGELLAVEDFVSNVNGRDEISHSAR
jgi:hypothetical protein